MTNDTNTIRNIVKNHIEQVAFIENNKIQDDSLIFKEGFFDSMGFVVLVTFLEEKFGLTISDEDLVEENFESINAITSFIIRKKGN